MNPFLHRKQALAAKAEAEKEGIVVPMTLEDYCIKPKTKPSNQDPPVSHSHFFLNCFSYLPFTLTTPPLTLFSAISVGYDRFL